MTDARPAGSAGAGDANLRPEFLVPRVPDFDSSADEPASEELPEWLRELFPYRPRFIAIAGRRMSVIEQGPAEAPPLLLLHGSCTWGFLFRHLIPRLRERYRVIVPDHIGFGFSDKPLDPGYHTLERHIVNFTELIETLNLRNVTMALHDWGGPIGLGYAVSHPENIARLLLCNTWGAPLLNRDRVRLPRLVRLAHTRLGERLEGTLHLGVTAWISAGSRHVVRDLVMEAYKYPFATGSGAALSAFWRMFVEPDSATINKLTEIRLGLKKLTCPAEVVWGELDPYLTKLPAFQLHDWIKTCRKPVLLRDAGHLVPEDAPDALAEILLGKKKPGAEKKPDSMFKIL